MSTDAEMEEYGHAAVYLRKSEKERMEAQARPFDSKAQCFVADKVELYLKGKITKRDGDKISVTLEWNNDEVLDICIML